MNIAKPLRLSTVEELKVINQIWINKIRDTITKDKLINNKRIYMHIIVDNNVSEFLEEEEGKNLKDTCIEVLKEIDKNLEFKSAGFLLNCPNCSDQSFHVDYSSHFGSVFCNLTPETEKCATQFINGSCEDICNSLSLVSKAVQFITTKSIWLNVPHGTIHRGIKNQELYDRIVFWILYMKKGQTYNKLEYESLYQPDSKEVISPYSKDENITV
jgi:hypothetical protein